jgi:hypothetical protein
MPYTLNGIGTRYYGKRDFRADGSYITTEWVTFIYIPLIPFRSLRVMHLGSAEPRFSIGVGSSDNYAVCEKTIPNWRQVLCIYSFASFVAAWAILVISFGFSMKEATLGMSISLLGPWLPAPIPWLLRHYARQQAGLSSNY